MRYVYLVERGSLYNGRFEFYYKDVYSSRKKAMQGVDNSLKINEAKDIEIDTNPLDPDLSVQITYSGKTDMGYLKKRITLERVEVI